jgi:3-dehydroquinate dehydratase-1
MNYKPRIVAVLGKNATHDLLHTSKADMIEVRLDMIKDNPLKVIKYIKENVNKPVIATNRWSVEGGEFKGSEEERMELLCHASVYADFVDIELKSNIRAETIERIDRPIIVSYHNFDGMPSHKELKHILVEISKTKASIAKIAVTPSNLKDNLSLLELLLESNMPLCVIAMGKLGRHLRAVAPIYGSVLSYGYVSDASAPGQMSIDELRQLQILLDTTN